MESNKLVPKIGDYIIGIENDISGVILEIDNRNIKWKCINDFYGTFKPNAVLTNSRTLVELIFEIIPKEVYESPLFQALREET